MNITSKEVAIIHHCLHFEGTTPGPLRELDPLAELPLAKSIFGKLPTKTSDDGKSTEFLDGEVNFEEAEKAYLLSITQRNWSLQDGIIFLGLRDKLLEKSAS